MDEYKRIDMKYEITDLITGKAEEIITKEPLTILEFIVKVLSCSKGHAKRLLEQGAIKFYPK